MPLNNVKRV